MESVQLSDCCKSTEMAMYSVFPSSCNVVQNVEAKNGPIRSACDDACARTGAMGTAARACPTAR